MTWWSMNEVMNLDTETRDYFDDKFERIGTTIHAMDMKVARMEERVNNGIVTQEICALRESGVNKQLKTIREVQSTMGKRMWAVLIAAVGSLMAAIVAHISR